MSIPEPPLEDGCIVNGQILITSYFDPQGRLKYSVGNDGEMNIAQVLGLLVLSGVTLFNSYMENEPYEPDEIEDEDDEDEDEDFEGEHDS